MIYASLRDCVSATHLQSLLAGLASVLRAASLTQRLLSPTGRGQSLRRVFPRQTLLYARIFCRAGEGCWRGRGCAEAAQLDIMPHVTAYGILAVQALFFLLGGIRDNFMTGKVIMPDEEYLQSWWYGVPLGTSETHSDRMECTACRRRVLVVALRHRREGFARAGTAGARLSVLSR